MLYEKFTNNFTFWKDMLQQHQTDGNPNLRRLSVLLLMNEF